MLSLNVVINYILEKCSLAMQGGDNGGSETANLSQKMEPRKVLEANYPTEVKLQVLGSWWGPFFLLLSSDTEEFLFHFALFFFSFFPLGKKLSFFYEIKAYFQARSSSIPVTMTIYVQSISFKVFFFFSEESFLFNRTLKSKLFVQTFHLDTMQMLRGWRFSSYVWVITYCFRNYWLK